MSRRRAEQADISRRLSPISETPDSPGREFPAVQRLRDFSDDLWITINRTTEVERFTVMGVVLLVDSIDAIWRAAKSRTIATRPTRLAGSRRNEVYFSTRDVNRKRGDRRGAAAAELAITAPLLVFVLVFAIDFCRVFYAYNTITNAARNGALWASDPLAATQSPYPTLLAAASVDASNLNPALTASNVTSSVSGTTVTVTVSYSFRLVTSYLGMSNVSLSRQVTMRLEPVTR